MGKQTKVRLFQGISKLLNLRYYLHIAYLFKFTKDTAFLHVFLFLYGGGLKRGNWLALLTAADRTY